MITKRLFIIFFGIICINTVFAQEKEIQFDLNANTYLGTENTPFWMRANQWGKAPTKGNTLAVFLGSKSEYKKNKNFDWAWGFNLGGFAGMQNKAILQQAYLKAKWKVFEIYGGRREEIQGLVDSTLSSGSYIWSGNALPLPKIDISIPNYTSFRKDGYFSFKGNLGHGFFDNKRADATGLMLHQKSFYFRLGRPNDKLKIYAGLNHQAQYGGMAAYNDTTAGITKGMPFGSTFRDFFSVFTGRSSIIDKGNTATTGNDSLNRIGNHLGSVDIAFELNVNIGKILIYRQSIYEDGSLFYLNNITDGLQGISFQFNNSTKKNFKLNKIVLEHFNSLSQGGLLYDSPGYPNIRGSDNYFNNSIVKEGWSYKNTSIGTPFHLTTSEFLSNASQNAGLGFASNLTQAYFLGVDLNIPFGINLISKYSYSKNWGSTGSKLAGPITQNSFLLQANKFLNIFGGLSTNISLALDNGYVFDSNAIIRFGLKKSFSDFPFVNSYPTHKH